MTDERHQFLSDKLLVLSDIASGLKASRRHLQRLLKLVCEDKVAEVTLPTKID